MTIAYIFLLVAIFAASANSVVLHKSGAGKRELIFKLNFIGSLCWCVILFVANGGKIAINSGTVLWALIYGVVQSLFVLSKAAAMSTGPVAITTLLGNSSLIISTLVSLLVWDERVSIGQAAGVLALLAGIVLCTYKKSSGEYSTKWKILSALFLIMAASVGITFKAFSKSGYGEFAGDMMFLSSIVMVISFAIMCALSGGFQLPESAELSKNKFLIFSLVSGALSCLYNRLNIFTSGEIDAVIFFPGFNGGVILLSAVLSVIFCRERLSKRQVAGIILGIVGICITGIL